LFVEQQDLPFTYSKTQILEFFLLT